MKKKALLALLMVMTLMLSSCSLIVKDEIKDANSAILKLGDTVVTKAEVQRAVDDVLYEQEQMYYYYYGTSLDVTDPKVISEAQSTAVAQLKQDMVLRAKAKELGLDQLTEEETAEAQESAQASMDYARSYVQSYMLTEEQQALEGEELEAAIQEALDALGVTYESYEKTATDTVVDNKLRAYAIQDVTVPDEDLKAEYDSRVAEDEETYKEDAAAWTKADRNGTTLYYSPAGIRRVKQILLKFKADDQTAIDEANDKVKAAETKVSDAQQVVNDLEAAAEEAAAAEAETTETGTTEAAEEEKTEPETETVTEETEAAATETETAAEENTEAETAETEAESEAPETEKVDLETAQANLKAAQEELEAAKSELAAVKDAAFKNLDEDADAILAALKEDPDSWDQLMEEKNEDTGLQAGAVNAEKGYAVCENMGDFDTAFVDAAMALSSVGDVSDKVRGESYGYYIIKYVGDVAEGAADYDSVKDNIYEDVLKNKQDETYTEAVTQWIKEAGVWEDLGALKD